MDKPDQSQENNQAAAPGAENYQLRPGYWANRPRDDKEKDWLYEDGMDWIKGYVKSREHPHRSLILKALDSLAPFGGLFEVGCNCGPNLMLAREKFPGVKLAGIDLNAEAIEEGKKLLPDADLRVGSLLQLPWGDKSFDIGISDAAFLYVPPLEIDRALSELNRVARKAVVMVERFDESVAGVVAGHVWARNYPALLEKLGFRVERVKLDEESWPHSFNWQKFGYVFIAKR